MRISLGITIRLATQAASVDPETYRPADEVMRKTYGLTIVTDTWNLYVMLAEKAQIGEREGEEMTNETMSQKKERLCQDLKVKAYVSFCSCSSCVLVVPLLLPTYLTAFAMFPFP